jgi:hypothetical protein
MPDSLTKLRDLLRELFQLDHADLDFGIYRVMNLRRDEITRFLDTELLPQVQTAFKQYQSSDVVGLTAELNKLLQQAAEMGVADPHTLPKVKHLRDQLAGSIDIEALQQQVFSDLYAFFRRYYSDGDFLSLRRYKEGVYAIPYEGEEVKLHWANHDQYYIKSSEYLRDYAFLAGGAGGKKVHFKLASADTEKDNNKAAAGAERRFILADHHPIEEVAGELILRFEYRPDDQKRRQSALNESAEETILKSAPDHWSAVLAAPRGQSADPKLSVLRHHLTQYTARNTFDYFIHKDLGKFLRRELDFFIKNEVMHLDDIESADAPKVEQYLSRIKVLRAIAHKIIAFLAQIEDFQKKLWLKKKFVIATTWLVTVDRIPGGNGDAERPESKAVRPDASQSSQAVANLPTAETISPRPETSSQAVANLPTAETIFPRPETSSQAVANLPTAETIFPRPKTSSQAVANLPTAETIFPRPETSSRPENGPPTPASGSRTAFRTADLRQVVADNPKQWAQWESLGFKPAEEPGLGPPDWGTRAYLDANDKLVGDTALFADDPPFVSKLLSSEEIMGGKGTLDEATTGTLVRSENFHALNMFKMRFAGQINIIRIDPPYNTDTSGFLYKNDYEHSSWLSFMLDRYLLAEELLAGTGSFHCHIDENEYERLQLLLKIGSLVTSHTMIWDKRNPMNSASGLANQHEYVIFKGFTGSRLSGATDGPERILNYLAKQLENVGTVNAKIRAEFTKWLDSQPDLTGGEKAYRFIDDEGSIYQGVSLRAPEPRTDPKFHQPLIHPRTARPCPVPPNGFSRTPLTLGAMVGRGEIIFGADESTQPRQKIILKPDTAKQLTSVMQLALKGKADLDRLGLDFPYCHPVALYTALIRAGAQTSSDVVLDYFAGSGTAGHAIIEMNRDDLRTAKSIGDRKFILVEVGEHFETVTKPRIAKVMYSPDWKDGRAAVHGKGISGLVKVLKLEGYEDTLNNLHLKRSADQQSLLDDQPAMREQYMLGYMLETESAGSPSLLNVDRFDDPFDYKLNVGTGTAGETRPVAVDLVETFNWLLGLRVATIDTIKGIRVVTGRNPAGEKVLILWRKAAEMPNEKLNKWLTDRRITPRDMEFDLIYVNGDNNLENLKRDDEAWKVRLIEEEFSRLMFDVQDV